MKAQPIWHPQHLEAVFVRHRFRLRQACAESLIRCAASGPYQVRLDNVRLGSGSGGSATHLPMWAEFAVEGSLSAGDHELLVQAAPAGEGAPPWVLCEGALTTSSGGDGEIGEVVQLATSANWWAAPSPTPGGLEAGADSEAFSALLDPTRDTAGDGEWVQAVAIPPGEASPIEGHPVAASEEEVRPVDMPSSGEIDLTAGRLDFVAAPGPMRTCKCVHREGILRGGRVPARVQTEGSDRAVYLILDFGRLVTGLPHLRLRHGAGGTIDMGFSCTWGQIHARARYICGSGRGEWVGLRSRTCRYLVLRLQGFEEACEIGCVSMLRPHIDAEAEATFSASGGVDAVWATGRQTLDDCRRDLYCLGETGDPCDWLRLRALALDDFYLTGEVATATATAASTRLGHVGPLELPALAGYPLFLESLHLYAGDAALARQLLPGVIRIVEAIAAARDGSGLVSMAHRGPSTIAGNALCCGALAAAARLCGRLGQQEEEAMCRQQADSLGHALQASRSSSGLFGDEPEGDVQSQWTNALILCFAIEEEERRGDLVEAMGAEGLVPVDDLLGAFYLASGLWEAGAGGAAMDIIKAHWTRIAERGGPTWQDKTPGQAGVVNPGPEYLLGSRLVGLRPLEPGYAVAEVRPPRLTGRQAGGRFPTARGWMGVEWRRHQGQHPGFELSVDQEEPGRTHLCIPRCGLRFPTITVNGETVWRNEKIYPNAAVREIISEPDYVVLEVEQAGRYAISAH